MIVQYDRNPALTTDQKLESLITSIQLALNEIQDKQHATDKKLEDLKAAIEAVSND